MKEITKSLGQTFYELVGESIPFIRSDLHLITKGKVKVKGKETVSPVVNDERNIVIEDEEREGEEEDEDQTEEAKKLDPEEARKNKEMEDIVEEKRVKKMNKTARVKHQAKKEARVEAERIVKDLAEREQR